MKKIRKLTMYNKISKIIHDERYKLERIVNLHQSGKKCSLNDKILNLIPYYDLI